MHLVIYFLVKALFWVKITVLIFYFGILFCELVSADDKFVEYIDTKQKEIVLKLFLKSFCNFYNKSSRKQDIFSEYIFKLYIFNLFIIHVLLVVLLEPFEPLLEPLELLVVLLVLLVVLLVFCCAIGGAIGSIGGAIGAT